MIWPKRIKLMRSLRFWPHFRMSIQGIYIIAFLLFNASLYEARHIKTFNHRLSTRGWKSNHFFGGGNSVNVGGNFCNLPKTHTIFWKISFQSQKSARLSKMKWSIFRAPWVKFSPSSELVDPITPCWHRSISFIKDRTGKDWTLPSGEVYFTKKWIFRSLHMLSSDTLNCSTYVLCTFKK